MGSYHHSTNLKSGLLHCIVKKKTIIVMESLAYGSKCAQSPNSEMLTFLTLSDHCIHLILKKLLPSKILKQ